MSLLFDALKRAQKKDDGAKKNDNFIDLSLSSSAINPSASLAGGIADHEAGTLAAQSIFSATARQSSRIVSLVVGGIALLSVVGVSFYLYYQRAIAPPSLAIVPPLVAPSVVAAPPNSGDQANGEPAVEDSRSSVEKSGQVTAEAVKAVAPNKAEVAPTDLVPIIARPGSEERPVAKDVRPRRRSPRRVEPLEQTDNVAVPSLPVVETSTASHLRLSVSRDPLREGYQALSEGRMNDAEQLYQEVIVKHPHERDALLGLAVIAHRQMQTERATDLYQQVLREDPGNSTATAALVTLLVQVDPVAAESRIKQLLDQKSTSPELHHVLGSVLARQKRWGEAQQSFFRAYSLAPGNAQYAYNLAVALDHLNKPAAALPYYEKTVRILRPGDTSIDRGALHRRVQELDGTLARQP